MDPLNFQVAPPRGPREQLAGIVFTARLIDKLRASLPGGELNGYIATAGFSSLWAHYTRIDLDELRTVVAGAPSESAVEQWIIEHTEALDKPAVNGKMERFESSRTPDGMRAAFESFYPVELRERHAIIFDLLEADDARLYAVD
jgi:uncharacterized protein DUF5069